MMDLEWMEQGLCRQTDPDLFYIDRYQHGKAAKRICAACPVRAECLGYGMKWSDLSDRAMYGGLTWDERKALRRAIRQQKVSL